MEDPVAADKMEVVDEPTVGPHRLGPDAGPAGSEVVRQHLGNELLERAAEFATAQGAVEFVGRHRSVPGDEPPQARRGE